MDEDRPVSDGPPSGAEGPSERIEPESSPSLAGMAVTARMWESLSQWQDPRIWILLLGRMMTAVGFSLFFPFLSIYLHIERGVPMGQVGILFLMNGLAGALSKVHGGVLADRWGRRRVMGLALLLRGISILGLAYLTSIRADVLGIGCLVVVSSYVGHFFIPAAHAMIADLTTGEKRMEGYGLFRVATNIGWAIGPALGGFFSTADYPMLLMITGSVYLLTAVVLMMLVAETVPEGAGKGGKRGLLVILSVGRVFLIYCLTVTLIYTVMGQMMANLSVFGRESVGLSNRGVGFLFALNGALVVILQVPFARFLRRARMTAALSIGSVLYAVGYGGVGVAWFVYEWKGAGAGYASLIVAMIVITFGEMIVQPAALTLAAKMSPEAERGRFLGVFGLFNNLGWSIGPLMGSYGLQVFAGDPWATWACVAALALIASVGFIQIRRILPPDADRPAPEQ